LSITKEVKSKKIKDYKINKEDTGSPEVQIAILTERINNLTEHFKTHPQDHHSKRGFMTLINRRKKLLKYLRNKNFDRYQKLIKSLGIRK